ncbi:MAG: class I SAM-dependent methyltransferase [Pseudomonadota bacterium]
MKCRLCAATVTHPFLDLGTAPPSNAYLTAEDLQRPEPTFPLRVKVCARCWLVQTEDFADAQALFSPQYAYFSATSSSWLKHSEAFVAAAVERFHLNDRSMVAEVAANDGYLLQYVKARGIPCYGIEPTASTAAAARTRGIDIVEGFLTEALGRSLAADGRQADLVIANNVLAHVPDLPGFTRGIAALLKPEGVASFEFPHLLRLLEGDQFDTIYHEHFSYLSLGAVTRLFADTGLKTVDVEELPTHGGSLRVTAALTGSAHVPTPAPARILTAERAGGLQELATYAAFQSRADTIARATLAYLEDASGQGLKVAAYGAAAKGNTLLNYAGVGADLIAMVADKSPGKIGRHLPGSYIPIVAPETLLAARPDRILILPWNIAPEIAAELQPARAWGARFVTAVPRILEF